VSAETSLPGSARASPLARILKVVAGATAVLSLAFALRQAAVYVTDHRDRQRRVAALLAAAELQRGGRDYRAAWGSLREAASVGARSDAVQTAREDLAMHWLDDASTADGLSLGAIGDTVAPVLTRGALDARGPRQGDLLAHLGWADFLRARDGRGQLDPAARYRQALAADSQNVFAHAMLAHWLLWGRDSLAAANRHFAAALASGRERPYVRRLQLAALENAPDAVGDLEMLRVVNAMRAAGDSVDDARRRPLFTLFYRQFIPQRPAIAPDQLAGAVPPTELLLTYRWLFATSRYAEAQGVVYTYLLARLEEAAGDTARALATYRAARTQAPDGGSVYRARIDAAVARLSRRR
jgi:hypothetical protein